MYEIPPSVDRYLRISTKSMIHFPTTSLESSLTSTLDDSQVNSPKKLYFSHRCDCTCSFDDKEMYLDNVTGRKRSCEEYDDNDLSNYKFSKTTCQSEADSSSIDSQADCTKSPESPVTASASNPFLMHETTSNGFNTTHLETHQRKLPELRPKTEGNNDAVNERSLINGKASLRRNPWGHQSYSELISGAIRASPENRASLQQIYDWIVRNIPWFHDKGDYPSTKGWKNAIRHTLSIRKRFERIVNERSPHASLWTFSKHGYKKQDDKQIRFTSWELP